MAIAILEDIVGFPLDCETCKWERRRVAPLLVGYLYSGRRWTKQTHSPRKLHCLISTTYPLSNICKICCPECVKVVIRHALDTFTEVANDGKRHNFQRTRPPPKRCRSRVELICSSGGLKKVWCTPSRTVTETVERRPRCDTVHARDTTTSHRR